MVSCRSSLGVLVLLIAGCSAVPTLQEDGVAVSEIVQRVKCEIAYAVPLPQGRFPTGRYQWLQNWTAKVDLNLITQDVSALTPGASLIRPLHTVSLIGKGTFSQSFTFGFGGGLTNTANRNESLSFTLSIAELRNPDYLKSCDLPDGADLYGHLGLKEWVLAALAPVDNDQLTIGKHTAGTSKAQPQAPRAAAGLTAIDKVLVAAQAAKDDAKLAADAAEKTSALAVKSIIDVNAGSPAMRRREIQDAFDAAATTDDYANRVKQDAATYKAALRELSDTEKADPRVKAAGTAISDATTSAAASTSTANKDVKQIPLDPPIDSIAHQVQFIVLANVNATPSWGLVNFKGPSGNGTFASLSETRTHTLTIAMGQPGNTVHASDDQLRQLLNFHLDALRPQPSQ